MVAAAVGVAAAAVDFVVVVVVEAAVEVRLDGAAVAVEVVAVDVADVAVEDVVSDVVEAAVLAVCRVPAESANARTPAPATELVAMAALTAFTLRCPRVRWSEVRFVMQASFAARGDARLDAT